MKQKILILLCMVVISLISSLNSMANSYLQTISTGRNHTVVLDNQSQVWTFGGGNYGQLGHGDKQKQNSAIPAVSLIEPAACKVESKATCEKNQDCECYCSQKCGFRAKTARDKPVYVKNDPNGIHCYCKEWDRQTYEEQCVEGKRIPRYKTN